MESLLTADYKYFEGTYKKLLHSRKKYIIIGIKPGRETPTKARLTSLKTPEATFPAPLKKSLLPKKEIRTE